MNSALIRERHIDWVVTKDSGIEGGFEAKCRAAAAQGVRLVVVQRPSEPDGMSVTELLEFVLARSLGKPECPAPLSTPSLPVPSPSSPPPLASGSSPGGACTALPPLQSCFPAFLRLGGRTVLVIGGGTVALRRVRTLLAFDCAIEVIAPELAPGLDELVNGHPPRIKVHRRTYRQGDCHAVLVTTATNDQAVNHAVAQECNAKGIPVSVADDRDESDFLFPAVAVAGTLVAGLSSGGRDHALVRRVARGLRTLLEQEGSRT